MSSTLYAELMRGKQPLEKIINEMKFLRSQGLSLPEISAAMDIPKTTVFRYIKGVRILPEFQKEWSGKRGGMLKKKLLQEKLAFEEGRKLVGTPSEKEKLLFLSALYWAEGSKDDFGLSNTDPELIRVFVSGLRELLHVTDDRLRISVRIYEDLDRERCLNFWSDVVKVPKENFVNINVLSGKKKGKLPYGMCRVRVSKGGILLKELMGINKAIVASLEHKSPL
jgi:hypothetical protein